MPQIYVNSEVKNTFVLLGVDHQGWVQDSFGNYIMTVDLDIYEALLKSTKEGEDINDVILRLLRKNGNIS